MVGIGKVEKNKRLEWLRKYPDPLAALRRMNWSNAAIYRDSGGVINKQFLRDYRFALREVWGKNLGKKETKKLLNNFLKPMQKTLETAMVRKERLLGVIGE